MADQNGGAVNVGATGMMTSNGDAASSLDGYGGAQEASLEERPELLVAAAFVAGILIGGLVSRLGR